MSEWGTGPKSDTHYLKTQASDGADAIAAALGRSRHSVKTKARKLGISLRKAGSTRGLVIGQPRSVSLIKATRGTKLYRDLILSGKLTASVVFTRIQLSSRGELDICPSCGKNPVTVKKSGLCEPCHLQELTLIADEKVAVLEAKKPLQAAWQRKSRLERQATRWAEDAVDEQIIERRKTREARS